VEEVRIDGGKLQEDLEKIEIKLCIINLFFAFFFCREGMEMEGGKPSEELEEVENELAKVGKKSDPESGVEESETKVRTVHV